MSEHVEHEHLGNWGVPFFSEGRVAVPKPVERDERTDWVIASVIFGGAIFSYGVAIGAIYLALTALF